MGQLNTLMRRTKSTAIICEQVGFISGICLPCYELLAEILPATTAMRDQCKHNLNAWKTRADERKAELEAAEEAKRLQEEKEGRDARTTV